MPSLTISLFSWTNRRFAFGSVCNKCLLFSSQMSFHFIALNTKVASCSTHACIFFIASKVYDATFIGLGVVSVKTSFLFVVFSPRALCLVCCFLAEFLPRFRKILLEGRKVVLHLRRLLIINRLVSVGS